jgi:hypothetical protein
VVAEKNQRNPSDDLYGRCCTEQTPLSRRKRICLPGFTFAEFAGLGQSAARGLARLFNSSREHTHRVFRPRPPVEMKFRH